MCLIYSAYILLLFSEVKAVIYYLNDTEYDRLPPIYNLDEYDSNLQEIGHTYCLVEFEIVSDTPSELLTTIRDYSEHSISHFNHTQLRYGIDIINSCQNMKNKAKVTDSNLERCLNKTFKEQYKLGVRVKHFECSNEKQIDFDIGDIITAVIILLILCINVTGTILDIFASKEKGDNFLLCFSLKRNWNKLTTPIGGPDPRLDIFRGLNGIKDRWNILEHSQAAGNSIECYEREISSLTWAELSSNTTVLCLKIFDGLMHCYRIIVLVGVVAAHSMWPFLLLVKHARTIELSYYDPLQYFLFNGTLAIQTYFVLTGLLLSYKMLLYLESVKPHWKIIFKGIFLRWLRLTPSYAVVLAVMTTLIRFVPQGPQWELAAGLDVIDCRARWWLNLIYFNNYVYNAQCMPHSWYIAADFQLCCIGMTAIVLMESFGYKKSILSFLFTCGIIIPAIQTYIFDLDGLLITSPGATRTFFATDPTFNKAYKPGHSNISSFVVGMMLGYVVYYWRQREFNMEYCRKYRYIYWAVAPTIFCYILSGCIFYRDAPRLGVYVRVLTAALAKPVFGAMIAVIVAGLVFKIENFYRSMLEWKVWTVPGRLSYCIYILHVPVIRIFTGTKTSLLEASKYNFFALMFSVLIISFVMAIPLWIFVESPFYELIKRHPKKQNATYTKTYSTHL